MPDSKFDLGDYIEVKDRIRIFYELYGQGRLVTDDVQVLTAPDGKQRVMVKALAYRSPDDSHPGVGHSWMELPGTTSYTRGSELENTETSAWGRAIASLGILIDKSIASRQEVAAKAGAEGAPSPGPSPAGSLIGIVEVGKTSDTDYEYRAGPDGTPHVGFVLVEGRKRQKVHAAGDLAEDLMVAKADLIGQRATCWGRLRPETFTPSGSTKEITYYVLELDRLTSGALTLTAKPEHPEAETVPLFSPDEEEGIEAAIGAA